jgi:glyoxylase-like metal-dependent hydrolase (beta-lactamase superfamily II)
MVQSIEKLLNYRFEWVLPGHGDRVHLSSAEMIPAVQDLVRRRSSLAVQSARP